MHPVNKQERNAAIFKFIALYLFSILLVLTMAYFWFNTPVGMFKSEIQRFDTTEGEQNQLSSKLDAATSNLDSLVHADEDFLNTSNVERQGKLIGKEKEYDDNIDAVITKVRNDSSNFTSSIVKKDSHNYITVFTIVSSLRNTIAQLEKTTSDCKANLDQALRQKSNSTPIVMPSQNPSPAPSSSGGSNSTEWANLKNQNAQLSEQVQIEKDSVSTLQAKITTIQANTKGSVPAPQVSQPSSNVNCDVQIANRIYSEAKKLYDEAGAKRTPLEQKKYYLLAAEQMFLDIKSNYPNTDALDKLIDNIKNEIGKTNNN